MILSARETVDVMIRALVLKNACLCADYCTEAGIEGLNCPPERLCVPQEHRCDGVPDCGFAIFAIDELNGCVGKHAAPIIISIDLHIG